MGTCFIIQPFDEGPFDKRYEDIFAPAVSDAGLEPYRVDRDLSVSIPIENIESGIRTADVCLAEITTDNPNVWFELGFAIASQKEVVLVCSKERQTKFPFDIQHRTITRYTNESPRDFQELRATITSRLIAIIKKEGNLSHVASMPAIADIQGLTQQEMVALVAIAENLHSTTGNVPAYVIRMDIEKAGFTKVATTLALSALLLKDLIEELEPRDYDGNPYIAYSIRPTGIDWLLNNQDKLVIHKARTEPKRITDDDIPF